MTPEEKLERRREVNRKWYAKNRESVLASHRDWRKNNPEKMKELNAKWYRENHERAVAARRTWTSEHPEYNRTWRLIKMGCSPEHYQKLLEETHGCCAICSKKPKVLHIDHDHKTQAIRSLLCFGCNTMLGKANDDPNVLRAAVAYLEKFKKE